MLIDELLTSAAKKYATDYPNLTVYDPVDKISNIVIDMAISDDHKNAQTALFELLTRITYKPELGQALLNALQSRHVEIDRPYMHMHTALLGAVIVEQLLAAVQNKACTAVKAVKERA